MSNDPINQLVSFIKREEPILAGSIGIGTVGFTVSTLEAHGVIGSGHADSLTKVLVPPVTAGALFLLVFLFRFIVSPAAAFAEKVEAEVQKRLASVAPLPTGVSSVVDAAIGQAEAIFSTKPSEPAPAPATDPVVFVPPVPAADPADAAVPPTPAAPAAPSAIEQAAADAAAALAPSA